MDSVKILLFSDDEKLYNSTERIIGKKHQLKWCTYQQLENNRYPTADVVIFHFTKEIIERERAFAAIIKIKGSLGHLTPILAISEGGSIQDIFSILKAGAYDYIETIDNTRKYKKKIENLNELQKANPSSASPANGKKEEGAEEGISENKLSYEAQKELNKKIKKLERLVADCEAAIEQTESAIAILEEKMATPDGASDMSLYEQHQKLKQQLDHTVEEWERVSTRGRINRLS